MTVTTFFRWDGGGYSKLKLRCSVWHIPSVHTSTFKTKWERVSWLTEKKSSDVVSVRKTNGDIFNTCDKFCKIWCYYKFLSRESAYIFSTCFKLQRNSQTQRHTLKKLYSHYILCICMPFFPTATSVAEVWKLPRIKVKLFIREIILR